MRGFRSRRRRRGSVPGALVACGVLVGALLVAAPPGSSADERRPVPADPASGGPGGKWPDRGLSAADEDAAMRLAYRTRARVEVLAARTGTGRTFANPDGTFALEQYAVPQWVRRGAGWVPVSTALRVADGGVVPEATAVALRFSGGGAGSLVTIGEPGRRLSLSWPGPLPAPVLDGDTATYREVLPGVDLVLRAEVDSFRQVLVVKSAKAAANPALRRVAFRISAPGLTVRRQADGVVTATDAAGRPVFASDGAAMWDSPPPGAKIAGDEARPRRTEKMAVQVSGDELAVLPAPAMLTDPGTVYPLYIDPSFNGGNEIWTHVSRHSPDTSYWTASNRDAIRVGQEWQSTSDDDWRAFIQFGTGVLNGATILSASFLITADHTADCGASPVTLWHTDAISTSRAITWNNMAAGWTRALQTVNASANESTCPKPDDQIEFGGANVKQLMQQIATGNHDTVTFGLRAPDEGDQYQWKKFVPGSAFMDVVYNHKPAKPTNQTIDSCYLACGSPAVVRSGTPVIAARVSDPNGGTLRTEYEVYDNARTTPKARSGTAVTGVPSGTARGWRVVPLSGVGPALPQGTYHWRARACDAYVCGDYSDWFTFTVDLDDPSLPLVSGSTYPDRSTGTWNGGPGVPGEFTFTGTGATHYVYRLNGGAATTVGAGAPQAELMPPNLAQVTGLTGFTGVNATLARVTDRGHDSADALRIAPAASQTTACGTGCTFASVGGDSGGMRLGMQAGKRYRAVGWVNVPAATGLSGVNAAWGLRIAIYYKVGGVYQAVYSAAPTAVDTWQRLAVSAQLPAGATEAFVRVFNGFPPGSTTKAVYWDDLSLRELVGDAAVESVTPTRDGLNTLSVNAIDAAGNQSDPRIYEFLVRPNGDLNWYWSFDEGTGASAASAPVNNRPAAFSASGVSWQPETRFGSAAVTTAAGGDLSTGSPVLDTAHAAGFTVAAWVRLTDLGSWRTAVSQDGVVTSMFRLGFRPDRDLTGDGVADPAWCFTVKLADSADSTSAAACTTDWVVAGDWVHLVGIYDHPAGKIKLYVNGTAQIGGSYAEAAYPAGWAATDRFAIGRAWHDGARADQWLGDLDEVYAEQEVWSDAEIDLRASQ